MSEPREAVQDFAARWLDAQRAFWEHWGRLPLSDEAYSGAEAFWEEACQRWWSHVGRTLPPPLDAQAEVALQQTRLILSLARGMARQAESAFPGLPGLQPEKVLATSFSTWSQLVTGLHPDPGMDVKQKRLLSAHAALVEALSRMMVTALERARERLHGATPPDPAACFDITCQELEREYRAGAGSDAFARLVGELVNARVQVLPAAAAGDARAGRS